MGNWLNKQPHISMLANNSVNKTCKLLSSFSSGLQRIPASISHSELSTLTLNASDISTSIADFPALANFASNVRISSAASSSLIHDIAFLPNPNSLKCLSTNRFSSCQNSSSVSNRPARKLIYKENTHCKNITLHYVNINL